VIEVRMHRDLYRGPAVDEAVELYGSYATLERLDVAEYWAVRVTGSSPERERQIAGELANFVLGLTVGAPETAPGGVAS
jgi:hypothetical protein